MHPPLVQRLTIAARALSVGSVLLILMAEHGTIAQAPPQAGLLLWLDAEQLGSAADPPASDSDERPIERPVERWPDKSGEGRDFVQETVAQRPLLIQLADHWLVRFDGQDDHLRCVTRPVKASAVTLVIVAAAHENPGDYRGFFAANAAGGRDYETGLNVDLGAAPSVRLETINIEGAGFGGARNLSDRKFDFGTLQILGMTADRDAEQVRLRIDGAPAGQRPWMPSPISLEELTLGARHYTNGPGEQQVRSALAGDIAEVLLYDRVLSDAEWTTLSDYLKTKHAALAAALPNALELPSAGIPLVKAADPPAVQMLVPGFRVRELPVELSNVNNVRFRDDGRLVTLGYNGDIHLLDDTDGDGLEDDATLFWKNEGSLRGPIGMLVTPPNYPHGQGVFTPSKGKLSLIVDTDGDDVADREITVAEGWKEIAQNVDATGITMGPDGSLYFGLGTADYSNAYLIDPQGEAQYRVDSERGTVQRVSPDFKHRETVATGVRFPIAFAFNQAGDLFCTDQEGATWLANGNPFDELLHIQPNRHYGFPPRHPRHNPNVIDEPSTFNYAPQHQSTCGMVFNEPVNGGPVFGPPWWAEDAIVCGESRGKLWRTTLVSTDAGYVASSQLLACLQMLTVDACVAPNGDLVVACHSGPPDWGTGPTGMGKLFRIQMVEPEAPRPANVWAGGSQEVYVAFDRPLDPQRLRNIREGVRIEYGEYVRAGDRFENLAPPYAAVQRQLLAPRHALDVLGVSVSSDLRTLMIQTAPMRANVHYALTLPNSPDDAAADDRAQHPQIDLDFTLHGVSASWAAGDESWSGWLPHLDWMVNDALTRHSAFHNSLRESVVSAGRLTLKTQLDLQDVLRPAVQPGSTLDYAWPEEQVTLVLRSSQPLSVEAGDWPLRQSHSDDPQDAQQYEAHLTVSGSGSRNVPLTVHLDVPAGTPPDLSLAVFTNEDETPRPLPLERLLLPWASAATVSEEVPATLLAAELQGGDWGRGRRVFHSQAAACFQCHAVNGIGQTIGPDLANLTHRDYASVLRDIRNPSFAINPDFISQSVLTTDGRILTGVLRTDEGQLLLGDASGQVTRLTEDAIESIHPKAGSIMPEGLDAKLSPDQFRDLMTFLMVPPPQMPLDSPLQAPPVRTRAEVAAVLAGAPEMEGERAPLNLVLVAGEKDHGPGEHDYPAWQTQWAQLLAAAENVTVDRAWGFPNDQQITNADVLVFFQKGAWDDHRQQRMDAFLARGGGAVYIHWAVNGDDRASDFSRRIGLASKGGSIGYRHGPLTLQVHSTDHPIMRNINTFQLYDESYWRLTGEVEDVTLLASSIEDGTARPQIWTYEIGKGRVFVSIPGHYSWTFDDPIFRTLLLRGTAWTAREPVDRFNDLVPLGARMAR